MRLQILVPQYKETDKIIKPLLDSIEVQQNVDLANEVGVIIVNDGTDIRLSDGLLRSYTYPIEYYTKEHGGVSAARDFAFNKATADYVMWCDADDMFFNVCALYIIFKEIEGEGFDTLVSAFMEESRTTDKAPLYVAHQKDSTFVHGKVHRRQYLIDQNIRFNHALTIHEDSPIMTLAQLCTDKVAYCPTIFYLWRYREDSVCRHDPLYMLKTYNNMLEGNSYLVRELVRRDKKTDAAETCTALVFDAYYSMNCKEWIDANNKEYREKTEKRFAEYYGEFLYLYESVTDERRLQINAAVRQRFFAQGLMFEEITFRDWIAHILSL